MQTYTVTNTAVDQLFGEAGGMKAGQLWLVSYLPNGNEGPETIAKALLGKATTRNPLNALTGSKQSFMLSPHDSGRVQVTCWVNDEEGTTKAARSFGISRNQMSIELVEEAMTSRHKDVDGYRQLVILLDDRLIEDSLNFTRHDKVRYLRTKAITHGVLLIILARYNSWAVEMMRELPAAGWVRAVSLRGLHELSRKLEQEVDGAFSLCLDGNGDLHVYLAKMRTVHETQERYALIPS